MRKKTLAISLIVFIIGAVGTGVCWNRQEDARSRQVIRREWIERYDKQLDHHELMVYGLGYAPPQDDAWRAAAVVLGAISLMGGLSAIVLRRG